MHNLDNPYLQGIFRKYGRRWDPSLLAEQQGEGSAARFAMDLEQYAAKIITGVTRKCPGLTVEVVLVENHGINAFAGKISDFSENYLVGIYSGTVTKLFETFNSETYLAALRSNLTVLQSRTDAELRYFSVYFASMFLVFHEFGHVVRGHINYASAIGAADAILMEGDAQTPEVTPEMTKKRYLSECDADAFAGVLLAGEIGVHSKNLCHDLRVNLALVSHDVYALAVTSIHFLFCLFDEARRDAHPFYPPPPLRSAIVHGHLAARLEREGQDGYRVLVNIVAALARVEALRHELGLKQGAYELGAAFEEWDLKYRAQLAEFSTTLVPYVPCKSEGEG